MKTISRRNFVKTAAMSALAVNFVPFPLRGERAPNERFNLAVVGVGGMGSYNLKGVGDANVVALCDVDDNHAEHVYKLYPKAKRYKDYRVMLEKQKDDIDGVLIATPDHTHAVIAMACMQEGKHVFCQKPLTHTVYEARKITEAARYYKIVTQMGNQGRSSEYIRVFKEWIDDGAIGEVKEVHAWTDRPVGGDPWSTFMVKSIPTDTPPVPDGFDWDLWLGPAAYRPYHPDYHPGKWRSWIDFGTGSLGDMGCHILDPAFYALDLGSPYELQASSTHWEPEVASQTFPRASIVRYKFPKNEKRGPVDLTWYDGRLLPPRPAELEDGRALPGSGALIIGEKGTIMHGSHGASEVRIIPEVKMREYKRPAKSIPRVKGTHEQDWIRACKEGFDGTPACSNFDYGGPLTEMVLLGMVAIQTKDQILKFDSKEMKFTNNDKANALLHKDYRKGWEI